MVMSAFAAGGYTIPAHISDYVWSSGETWHQEKGIQKGTIGFQIKEIMIRESGLAKRKFHFGTSHLSVYLLCTHISFLLSFY